jgi:hypothetical protein
MPAAALSVPLSALPLVTSDCTSMCTLAPSTVPSSARICVLRPLKVNSQNFACTLLWLVFTADLKPQPQFRYTAGKGQNGAEI